MNRMKQSEDELINIGITPGVGVSPGGWLELSISDQIQERLRVCWGALQNVDPKTVARGTLDREERKALRHHAKSIKNWVTKLEQEQGG